MWFTNLINDDFIGKNAVSLLLTANETGLCTFIACRQIYTPDTTRIFPKSHEGAGQLDQHA